MRWFYYVDRMRQSIEMVAGMESAQASAAVSAVEWAGWTSAMQSINPL